MAAALATPALSQQPAQPVQNGTTTLGEVVVTAEAPGYSAREATTALKADVPLLQIPQAVSVVPRKLIEDQGARKLEEVLRNTAGVSTGGYYSDWDYYRIRGFDAAFTTYLDGLRAPDGDAEELWGLERVEVVKGPASSLYGQGPLGGMVNMVSKRPKPEFFGELQLSGGSFDFYEAALDINGPLLTERTPAPAAPSAKGAKNVQPVAAQEHAILYGRLNMLYRNEGSFVDHSECERFYIAPSLTWEISPDTTLTLLGSYKTTDIYHSFPLPARGTVLPNIHGEVPIDLYVGNPAKRNHVVEESGFIGYDFRHRFNDSLTLRQNFRYQGRNSEWNDLYYPAFLDVDDRTLHLSPYRARGDEEEFLVDTALDAKFDTGAVKHLLTFGVDYFHNDSSWTSSYALNPASIDVFRPNYATLPPIHYGPWSTTTEEVADLGIYLQEQARFFDKLTVTLGGRYDFSSSADDAEEAFSPKAGITYEFTPGVALYANWGRSFNPQWFYRDASGQSLEPEKGENLEAGIKGSLLDGRVTALLAVYQLTRENVATAHPLNPFVYNVSGEQRSRGVEFETAMQLAPGLSLTSAYSYIDAEVTEDLDLPVGTPLQGVPEHNVNAWLKYSIQSGALKGLGFGVGGRYYSSQSGDLRNSFDLPAYGLLDTALYYEREKFSVQVNFNNVLDRRHFVGSYDTAYVLPGEPFNVTASVKIKF